MAVAALTAEQVENASEAIERSLWRYPSLRSDDIPVSFDLEPDGSVTVRGHVRSRTIKEGVLELVGSVEGVTQVIDQVYADPDLEGAIAQALVSDERTAHLDPGCVQIFGQRGVMVLVGQLESQEDVRAVCEVASEVEGVAEIVSRLTPAVDR